MSSTRRGSAIAALMLALAALAAPGAAQVQELPPAIQVDRYLREATGHIEDGDGPAALAALDRVLALQAEHGIEIPDAFWFRQAQAALAAQKADMAVESVTRYLQQTLGEGEHYEPAVDLLIEAEALQARFAPGSTFSDCDVCPRMVVVPAGTFTMGSPASEEGRRLWRLRAGRRRLGTGEPPGDQGELGRRAGVRVVALAADERALPAVERAGMGVRGPGGLADGALLGRE